MAGECCLIRKWIVIINHLKVTWAIFEQHATIFIAINKLFNLNMCAFLIGPSFPCFFQDFLFTSIVNVVSGSYLYFVGHLRYTPIIPSIINDLWYSVLYRLFRKNAKITIVKYGVQKGSCKIVSGM